MTLPSSNVLLLVLSGERKNATQRAQELFPGAKITEVEKAELRHGPLRQQWRAWRKLQGRAFVVFGRSRNDFLEPQLFVLATMVHRCRETVLSTPTEILERVTRVAALARLPGLALALLRDYVVIGKHWLRLRREVRRAAPQAWTEGMPQLAFLYTNPTDRAEVGGAVTHVRGFLGGLNECGARVKVFSARPWQDLPYDCLKIDPPHGHGMREAFMLGYNRYFAARVRLSLDAGTTVLYQRHARYMDAGATLSRQTGLPLVLEFNGSEVWVAQHWDPARFPRVLALAEEVALRSATLIVVVSEELRQQVLEKGVEDQRILVNPNGVDPERFRPNAGGEQVRARLGFAADEIVVGFLSTFSYWHGVEVLRAAIERMTTSRSPFRFLLLGEGPLRGRIAEALRAQQHAGQVQMPGAVPHEEVPAYLDACDVLVSPHLPLPDGKPFFGSPTKIFEYMAMQKPIVASALDQIATVLRHGESALLTPPGDAEAIVKALERLAQDRELASRLARNARQRVTAEYSWRANAQRVLDRLGAHQVAERVHAGAGERR